MSALGDLVEQWPAHRGASPLAACGRDAEGWDSAAVLAADGRCSCSACGANETRDMALCGAGSAGDRGRQPVFPEGAFPSLGRHHPPAIRLERAIRDLFGLEPQGAVDARPWLDHGRWGRRQPLAARKPDAGARRALCLPAGRRREPAPDSGRPGSCRHHRARSFPLHRERRDGRAPGGAAGLCAQRHRGPDGGRRDRARRKAGRPHVGRQHRRLCLRLRTGGRDRAGSRRRRRARNGYAR